MNECVRFERTETAENETAVRGLSKALSISEITARAMVRRGVETEEDARVFLSPEATDLNDPSLLPDIDAALERIFRALKSHERICIYGDYDADGVLATTILYKQLARMNAMVECFVPSRHEDGYGMHESTVELLCENGIDLIITVDNGITANDEIALCAEYGVDVIVTDHHIPHETLPDCVAVVAASRTDSQYPFRYLCGAGIAFKLACALSGKVDTELLGLAAIATMADIVPLIGENRTIVRLGLPYARANAGIDTLFGEADFVGEPDARSLAFVIAPRLNAAGRMGDASRAIALMTAQDPNDRIRLAGVLQRENNLRKESETTVLNELYERYTEEELQRKKVIVIFGAGWNVGVLGIVASRLCEKYYKPVLLFSEHKENWVGSGRSIPTVHLHDALLPFRERFLRFGGHSGAVGVTIEPKEFESFVADFERYVDEHYTDDVFIPRFQYEQQIGLNEISTGLIDELSMLEPYGESNELPAFLIKDVRIAGVRRMGKAGEHLEGEVSSGSSQLRFLWFRNGGAYETLSKMKNADIICTLQNNSFRGNTSAELLLVVAREAEAEEEKDFSELTDAIRNDLLYNKKWLENVSESFGRLSSKGYHKTHDYSADAMRQAYRTLRMKAGGNDGSIALNETEPELLIRACVFLELGFLQLTGDGTGRISFLSAPPKRDLNDSALYRQLTGNNN